MNKLLLLWLIMPLSAILAQTIDYRMQIKNKPFVYVTDAPYNAKCNGTTDDTVPILAAMTAMEAVKGQVLFPQGNCLFSQELPITSRLTMTGCGAGQGTGAAKACTILTKTADVIGIHLSNGASQSILQGFQLNSTASTGTSDNIVVGDAVNSSLGISEAEFRDLVVTGAKGNGINIRNGVSGVIDHVIAVQNGGAGILLDSKATDATNVNAWRLYNVTAVGNQDGIYIGVASSNSVYGVTAEGNSRYGVYSNQPYTYVQGYVEANTSGSVYFDGSCFDCISIVRDVTNNPHQGNSSSFMFNMAGSGTTLELNPTTGALGVRGGLRVPLCTPTYGTTVTINNDSCNYFKILVTNGSGFTVATPTNQNFPQDITIEVKNNSGSTMGTITWPSSYILGRTFVNPLNGCSRSIEFRVDPSDGKWTEQKRGASDVCTASLATDFVKPTTKAIHLTGLTASASQTAFSFPNVGSDVIYNTRCSAYVTTADTAGTRTVALNLQPYSTASVASASNTIDLTNSQSTASVQFTTYIPANTSGASIGLQYLVTNRSTGVFEIDCTNEQIQVQ